MARSVPPQHPSNNFLHPEESPHVRQMVTSQNPGQSAPVNTSSIGKLVRRDSSGDDVLAHRVGDISGGKDVTGGFINERSDRPLASGHKKLPRRGLGMSGHNTDAAIAKPTQAKRAENSADIKPGNPIAFGRDGVPAAAGQIAHRVIAEALSIDKASDIDWIDRRVKQLGKTLGRSLNARRVYGNAATSVVAYLRFLRPTTATLLHAEETISGVRPDLAWQLPAGAVFFDELKTGRYVGANRVAAQAHRQVEAGWNQYHLAFVGVRVISTASAQRSLLFDVGGTCTPLDRTWLNIADQRTQHNLEVS